MSGLNTHASQTHTHGYNHTRLFVFPLGPTGAAAGERNHPRKSTHSERSKVPLTFASLSLSLSPSLLPSFCIFLSFFALIILFSLLLSQQTLKFQMKCSSHSLCIQLCAVHFLSLSLSPLLSFSPFSRQCICNKINDIIGCTLEELLEEKSYIKVHCRQEKKEKRKNKRKNLTETFLLSLICPLYFQTCSRHSKCLS